MANKKLKRCLVVIPCLNEEEYIEAVVQTFLLQINAKTDQILIIDGGSTDQTLPISKNLADKYEPVSLLHNPRKFQSAAINLAVQKYGQNYEWLLRVDAHCTYPNDFVSALFSEAQKTKADSVTVGLRTHGVHNFQKAIADTQNSLLGNGGSSHRLQNKGGKWVDHGHHALMKIEAFQTIGGYDVSFTSNEDAELDTRLVQAGYKIWLTEKTSVIYYPRKTVYSLALQYFRYGSGRCMTFLKHKQTLKFRQLIPLFILASFIGFPLSIFNPAYSFPALIWIGGSISYGFYLGIKNKSFYSFFLSGIAAMIMHAGWGAGFIYQYMKSNLQKSGA